MGDRCEVCTAPTVLEDGHCAFCRSPASGEADPQELLDYLAMRLPHADVRRTFVGRGPIREVTLKGKLARYSARMHRGFLELDPDVILPEWVEMLMGEVSRQAISNPDVRRTVSRAGWAFR
jgi:hypothetical protein